MTATHRINQLVKEHLSGALFSCETPRPDFRGKVRDIYDRGDTLVMVNTDRVSAFDHVLGTIPLKGALLAEQAEYWFNVCANSCPTHFVDRPDSQIIVCKKAQPILVEVVVRGYLAGSLMREDKETRGASYGLRMDPTLKNYQKLPEPIITPTTKAPMGEHDVAISARDLVLRNLASVSVWQEIEELAINLFNVCSQHAANRGLLLVDTKYEFGMIDGRIHLIDEVHTSDSSRFFIAEDYVEKFAQGQTPLMLDKEFLRQHLMSLGVSSANVTEMSALSDEIRETMAERYFLLTEKITGHDFSVPSTPAHERVERALHSLIAE